VLALEELEIAGSALERGEATRSSATALRPAAAIERREGRGRADEASEEERTQPATAFAVHAPILRS
jgi:hypothetical protein